MNAKVLYSVVCDITWPTQIAHTFKVVVVGDGITIKFYT